MEQVSTTERRHIDNTGETREVVYNYEAMWDKLRLEMERLIQWNVTTHPVIVLAYMGFISQEERTRQLLKGDDD